MLKVNLTNRNCAAYIVHVANYSCQQYCPALLHSVLAENMVIFKILSNYFIIKLKHVDK